MEPKKSYTSRMEKNKLQEEYRKELEKQKERVAKEKELDKQREEIRSIIFNDEKPKTNTYQREVPKKEVQNTSKKTKKVKIPKTVVLILSLTLVITIAFSAYLIYDSFEQINQIYQMINAILILLIVISFLIAFKRSFHYRKTAATSFTAFCIICLIVFNGLYSTGLISLPTQNYIQDFSSASLTEVISWAEANEIEYEQTYEYSDSIKKYSIITQSEKEGTLTKNIDNLFLTVSDGPDYSKEVIITDMTDWNIDEAIKVIDENLLSNVTVNFVDNPDIERDTITEQSSVGTMKRNDELILTVSFGNIEELSSVELEEMTDMTLFKAILYLSRNNISYELSYEFSDNIEKGNVIETDVSEGTEISPGDTVKIIISKGKKITVPNLEEMTVSEVTKWAAENRLKINYSDAYSNDVKKGKIIEASYNEGDIIEEDTTVDITASKGKLKLQEFDTISEFIAWASEYDIKYEINKEFNDDIEKDNIIKYSIEVGGTVDLNETITVYVSKGKAVTVPNFIGMNQDDIKSTCDKLNIVCTFKSQYSTSEEGTAIAQSISENEEISEGDTIVITIASSSKVSASKTSTSSSTTTTSKTSTSSSSSSSSSGSSSGSSSSSSSSSSSTTGKTYTVYIQSGWVETNSSTEACSQIQEGIHTAYSSKINITCSYKSSDNRPSGKVHEDSAYQVGQSYSFTEGKTYNFIIVK